MLRRWLYRARKYLFAYLNKRIDNQPCPYGPNCRICPKCGQCEWHSNTCWMCDEVAV